MTAGRGQEPSFKHQGHSVTRNVEIVDNGAFSCVSSQRNMELALLHWDLVLSNSGVVTKSFSTVISRSESSDFNGSLCDF